MNTANSLEQPVPQTASSITTQQLMSKLLELEKKLDLIEKKLTTPLINR